MQETTNKYLELSTINTSRNKTLSAMLTYKGGDFTASKNYSRMSVFKFNIISNNFPTFLPEILNEDENKNYVPYIPEGVKESDVVVHKPPVNYAYNITDWQITLGSKEGDKPTVYKNTFIAFPILKKYFPQPIEYDDENYITEEFRLQNDIFWGNSEMICQMVTTALLNLSGQSLRFVKNGSHWSLLQNTADTKTYTVFFNKAMRNYFSFDYLKPSYSILLVRQGMTSLDKTQYFVNSTIQTNIKLFPFRNVRFCHDDGLNIFPLWVFTQSNGQNENPFENVLSQYTLNIADINELGNCIEFSTETKDRFISLTSDRMQNFNISVQFVTARKAIFNLKLEYLDEVNMLLMFE